MRACWLKWVGRDWSISADYIWLNYSDANIDTVPIESMDFIVADTEGSVHPVTLKARVSPTTAARGADRFMVCSFLRHLVNAVFGWLIRLIISAYLAER